MIRRRVSPGTSPATPTAGINPGFNRQPDDGDLHTEIPLRPHSGWVACVCGDRDAETGFSTVAVSLRRCRWTCAAADGRSDTTDGDQSQRLVVGRSLVVVLGLVLTWVVAGKYFGERQANLETMKGFGDKFISEFERPLFRRSASESAVKSRLRFTPRRRTLEVLLAPAKGRTYPNLFDHRRNVGYDVERVRRL